MLVTLDITPEVVAGSCGKAAAQLIVAHHPVIFDPLKKLAPPRCALPAGAGGHLCHLYAHQSGCRRGRRERGAGRHLWHAGTGTPLPRAAAGWATSTPSRCRSLAGKAQAGAGRRGATGPENGPAVQVKFADAGRTGQGGLAVIWRRGRKPVRRMPLPWGRVSSADRRKSQPPRAPSMPCGWGCRWWRRGTTPPSSR